MPVFRSELLAIKTLRGGVSMKFRAAFSEGPEPTVEQLRPAVFCVFGICTSTTTSVRLTDDAGNAKCEHPLPIT